MEFLIYLMLMKNKYIVMKPLLEKVYVSHFEDIRSSENA